MTSCKLHSHRNSHAVGQHLWFMQDVLASVLVCSSSGLLSQCNIRSDMKRPLPPTVRQCTEGDLVPTTHQTLDPRGPLSGALEHRHTPAMPLAPPAPGGDHLYARPNRAQNGFCRCSSGACQGCPLCCLFAPAFCHEASVCALPLPQSSLAPKPNSGQGQTRYIGHTPCDSAPHLLMGPFGGGALARTFEISTFVHGAPLSLPPWSRWCAMFSGRLSDENAITVRLQISLCD
jgi:hypothetical protein